MSLPLQGCEYNDFMTSKQHTDLTGYCIRCGKEIGHKGTSEYCTLKCAQADYTEYTSHDSFRNERHALDNKEWEEACK